MIEIWAPKYSTNEVLIATHAVRDGDNLLYFSKAPHLRGKIYKVDGALVRKCKKQKNGRGQVYCVPFESMLLVTNE